MKTIDISIVMPAYNSEATIKKALLAVREQTFPQGRIEILVIDGGSNDNTVEIAQKFKARTIINPKRLPEYAKEIGLREAKGKYCVFLDSDEVLLNKNSLQMKYDLLEKNDNVHNVLIGGLKNPPQYPFMSEYVSRIGDPFSFFMYGIDADDFQRSLSKRFKNKTVTPAYTLYHITNEIPPICDSGGHFFKTRPGLKTFAVFNNDYIEHYSTVRVPSYLQKIKFRVVTNLFNKHISGFSEREGALPVSFRLKKLLFIPLSLTIVWPIYSATALALTNKNYRFFMHVFFSFYTACAILFYFFLKMCGIKPTIQSYGK